MAASLPFQKCIQVLMESEAYKNKFVDRGWIVESVGGRTNVTFGRQVRTRGSTAAGSSNGAGSSSSRAPIPAQGPPFKRPRGAAPLDPNKRRMIWDSMTGTWMVNGGLAADESAVGGAAADDSEENDSDDDSYYSDD